MEKGYLKNKVLLWVSMLLGMLFYISCGTVVDAKKPADAMLFHTVTEYTDPAKLIAENWNDDYFGKMTMNVGSLEIQKDGKESDLTQEFNISTKKAKKIVKSKASIKGYLEEEDTIYETKAVGGDSLQITAPYQTKRLIVLGASLSEYYGASYVYSLPEYEEWILQFSTEEETKNAYDAITDIYGENICYLDEVVLADDLLETDNSTESYSAYSWGSRTMGMEYLKNQTKEYGIESAVSAAVIDSGMNQDNFFFSGRTISDYSYNFVDNSSDIADTTKGISKGHGTHVCGIIADSTPDNVEIMMLKVFNNDGGGSVLSILSALQYAIGHGADVINMSLGFTDDYAYLYTFLDGAIEKAYEERIPVCVAAGNDRQNTSNDYPSSNDQVFTVSAIKKDSADQYAFASNYSNFGSRIDFCAPGTSIDSAGYINVSDLRNLSGTSMAAPHLAAAIAYLKLVDSTESVDEIYEKLKHYSVDLGTTGRDIYYGWGYPEISNLYKDTYGEAGSTHIHSWKKTLVPASCTEVGQIIYTCTCGESRQEIIPAGGHAWIIDSDHSSTMRVVFTCGICGAEKSVEATGVCGGNLRWSYDFQTGVLEITGTGPMTEYGKGNFPWEALLSETETLEIGENVTTIASYAFYGTEFISDVTLSANLTEIGSGAFGNCPFLQKFTVKDDNPFFSTEKAFAEEEAFAEEKPGGSCLYSKDKSILYACGAGVSNQSETFTFLGSNGLKKIKEQAFAGCRFMESAIFPVTVTSVEDYAFYQCTKLKDVYFKGTAPVLAQTALLPNVSVHIENLPAGPEDTSGSSEDHTDESVTEGDTGITPNPLEKITVKPVKGFKVRRLGYGRLQTTWKKEISVSGYKIQYSSQKNFKNKKTISISKNKIVKYTIKNLKKGRNYYLRIRTYKKSDGKTVYSSWSSVKKILVK